VLSGTRTAPKRPSRIDALRCGTGATSGADVEGDVCDLWPAAGSSTNHRSSRVGRGPGTLDRVQGTLRPRAADAVPGCPARQGGRLQKTAPSADPRPLTGHRPEEAATYAHLDAWFAPGGRRGEARQGSSLLRAVDAPDHGHPESAGEDPARAAEGSGNVSSFRQLEISAAVPAEDCRLITGYGLQFDDSTGTQAKPVRPPDLIGVPGKVGPTPAG